MTIKTLERIHKHLQDDVKSAQANLDKIVERRNMRYAELVEADNTISCWDIAKDSEYAGWTKERDKAVKKLDEANEALEDFEKEDF